MRSSLLFVFLAALLGVAAGWRPVRTAHRGSNRATSRSEDGATHAVPGFADAGAAPLRRASPPRATTDVTSTDRAQVDVDVLNGETGERIDTSVTIEILPPRGAGGLLRLAVDVPDGFVPAVGFTSELAVRVPHDVHTVRATFILVPVVRVVLQPEPRFRGRVRRSRVRMGGRELAASPHGPLVYLVPRHAGAPLTATIETAEAGGRGSAVLAAHDEHVVVQIPYPVPDAEAAGPRSGVLCRGAPGMPSIAHSGDGELQLRVLDRNGQPAIDARVEVEAFTPDERLVLANGTTDDEGELVFAGLPACSGTAIIVRHRGLHSVIDFDVVTGRTTAIRVDAPPAVTAVVEVSDRRGRPVAFACVEPTFDLRDLVLVDRGVLTAPHVTDVTGRCTLRGAPPRGLQIDVRWGGVTARATPDGPARWTAVLPLPADE